MSGLSNFHTAKISTHSSLQAIRKSLKAPEDPARGASGKQGLSLSYRRMNKIKTAIKLGGRKSVVKPGQTPPAVMKFLRMLPK